MNHDDVEQQLRRQPVKIMPAAWRSEILAAALEAAGPRPSPLASRPAWFSTALWPSPVAWAGVAAAWLLILGLNHAASLPGAMGAMAQRPALSPEVMRVAAAGQQRIMRELMGGEASAAVAPRPAPGRPRSFLSPKTLVV